MGNDIVLEICDLAVAYPGPYGDVLALQDVNLTLRQGEIVGLVGESGSGKSTMAFAVMRLLKNGARLVGGHVLVAGRDIYHLEGDTLRNFRWKTIAMVFQSAMNALNPVLTVGEQIADTIQCHESATREQARERAANLLNMVRIDPTVLGSYPHELSGGMRQRVVIAIALALSPQVLLMDEPTTALDVVVQRTILDQILELQAQLRFAILFISHDFSLVTEMASRVAVMYAGRMVEVADHESLKSAENHHPYTQGLMRAIPHLTADTISILGIAGNPPDLRQLPSGCAYHPRCEQVMPICSKTRPRTLVEATRMMECHLFDADTEVHNG